MRIPSVGSVRAGVFKFCWIKKLMINIGLVLLQKESKYEASLYESFLSVQKVGGEFAPKRVSAEKT